MPSTTSNTQSTTSDNGRNVRAQLYAESYFFLEKDTAFSQSSESKFGITGTNSNSKFHTTSKITFTGIKKIFVICKGQIFVQPCIGHEDKVNVILRPFSQPVKGLAIKYFIYRGLNKSDFFENGKIKSADEGNATEFVNIVRKQFKDFYKMLNVSPEPEFLADFIGYQKDNTEVSPEEQQQLSDPIDDYFFKTSKKKVVNGEEVEENKTAFELPIIPQGTWLGNADSTFGIDVVLNEGDFTIENDPNPFQLNLSYARASDYELDYSAYTGIQAKLMKESAIQFLDIASFYGLHAQGIGKVFVKSQTDPLKTVDEIYNLIKNFQTKNTVYLYIQSNRQRSYNFYGNYNLDGNNIKIGITEDNLQEKQFGENGWPVLEFEKPPSLVLQLITDNYPGAGLYVKQGLLDASVTENEDYFIRNKNLLQEADSEYPYYTKSIGFSFVKAGNDVVSSFIQMIYEGKQISVTKESTDPNVPTETFYMKDIDDVFGLINATAILQPQNSSETAYVTDQNLLLINFENKTGGQDIATVTTKRVEDKIMKDEENSIERVTYETLLNTIRQNTGSFFESRSAYLDNANSGMIAYSNSRNNFYKPESPYYLQTEVFTGNDGNTITGLSLQVEDGTLPSKKLLGITDDENEKFRILINDHVLNNPKFFFKNELENEESYYTSSEGTEYRKYSLCVIGENQNGELQFYEPTDKVFVTTVDRCVFASEEYSKWVPKVNDKEININPMDIKIYE